VIDALGRPQSVLLLGASSDIALAVLRALPPERLRRVVLAARDVDRAKAAAGELLAGRPGEAEIEIVSLDAADTGGHRGLMDTIFDRGDIDVTVLAVGSLGDQVTAEATPELAVAMAQVTYLGATSLLLHVATRLRQQGHGILVVLSSVAAARARPSNYLYGSAKAGLDHAARGVLDSFEGNGCRLLLVRAGFVRSRMTAHLKPPPLAIDPRDVATEVVRHLGAGSHIVYVPRAARAVAALLALAPRRLLRRLPA